MVYWEAWAMLGAAVVRQALRDLRGPVLYVSSRQEREAVQATARQFLAESALFAALAGALDMEPDRLRRAVLGGGCGPSGTAAAGSP